MRFGSTTVSAATVLVRRWICPSCVMSLDAIVPLNVVWTRPLLRALGEIDRELDRLPRAVVPRLPVVHRQIDRRAQLSRPAQRPAVGRFQHRDFFDAGVGAADEHAERVCRRVVCAAASGRLPRDATKSAATTAHLRRQVKCLRDFTLHQDSRCFLSTSTTPRTIPPSLIDRSSQGTIALTGGDRASFLHALLTNDIARLTSGQGVYAAYLTPQGRMISDMRVIETGSRMLLGVERDIAAPLAERFDKLIFSEDVQAKDVTGELDRDRRARPVRRADDPAARPGSRSIDLADQYDNITSGVGDDRPR